MKKQKSITVTILAVLLSITTLCSCVPFVSYSNTTAIISDLKNCIESKSYKENIEKISTYKSSDIPEKEVKTAVESNYHNDENIKDFFNIYLNIGLLMSYVCNGDYTEFNTNINQYLDNFFIAEDTKDKYYFKIAYLWFAFLEGLEYKKDISPEGYQVIIEELEKYYNNITDTEDIDKKATVANMLTFTRLARGDDLQAYDEYEQFYFEALKYQNSEDFTSNKTVDENYSAWVGSFLIYNTDLFEKKFENYYNQLITDGGFFILIMIPIKLYESYYSEEDYGTMLTLLKSYYPKTYQMEFLEGMQIRDNNLAAQQSIYLTTGQMDEYKRVSKEIENVHDEWKAYYEETTGKKYPGT